MRTHDFSVILVFVINFYNIHRHSYIICLIFLKSNHKYVGYSIYYSMYITGINAIFKSLILSCILHSHILFMTMYSFKVPNIIILLTTHENTLNYFMILPALYSLYVNITVYIFQCCQSYRMYG